MKSIEVRMRYAVEKPHLFLQILFALLVITLLAFAISGCPVLGKEQKLFQEKKAVGQLYSFTIHC